MESMLHPGPFRAEERGGGHVVVDARGEVVARVEGEWPHRTADAITRALNDERTIEELQSEIADLENEIESAKDDAEGARYDARRDRRELDEVRAKLAEAQRTLERLRAVRGEGAPA